MSEVVPLTRMRRAITKAMTLSASVPQFAIEMTLDASLLSDARAEISADGRPSFTDALVASVARAARSHPTVNSSFTDEGIIEHDEVNVALATAIDEGLVSPVIANADRCTITEIAAERRRLVDAARTGALTPSELLSATFTLSNLGPFGVTRFTALVVPPQAAILAAGSLSEKGVVLTLSADHRVVDGAPAAVFLRRVIDQLEDRDWIGALFSDEGLDPRGGEVS